MCIKSVINPKQTIEHEGKYLKYRRKKNTKKLLVLANMEGGLPSRREHEKCEINIT